MKWRFFDVWNNSLLIPDRVLEPREHIWASEIGGSYIDRYLKMTGTTQTNPPNDRSRRKFQAGHVWEWIVGFVLQRAGLIQSKQDHVGFQYPGLLKVTGRIDYIAGGVADWERAQQDVKAMDLPDFMLNVTENIINQLGHIYQKELPKIVFEMKSVSSMMFERYLKTEQPNAHHVGQIFHYLKATGMEEGHIIYVCKDDCRILEFPVYINDAATEAIYKGDIETMTNYFNAKEIPPLEKMLIFNEQFGKFEKNWKVEYSGYLTQLYNFKQPEDYRTIYQSLAQRNNRVMKRFAEGAKLTEDNLKCKAQIIKDGFDFDQCLTTLKAVIERGFGLGEEEEE